VKVERRRDRGVVRVIDDGPRRRRAGSCSDLRAVRARRGAGWTPRFRHRPLRIATSS
jgi:hypothetical protein